MAKSVFQVYIEDEGVIVPSALITVRKSSDNSLATIYSDDTGTAKANPFTATINGLARFYADGGSYTVTATSGLFSTDFIDVLLGDAQGFDVGNAFNKLMTRATADARYLLQGAILTPIIDTQYFTAQNPTGTNAAMQIIFNNADILTTEVNVLGAANGTPANRGKINWQIAGQYILDMTLIMARTGAGGISNLYMVFKENGVAVASEGFFLLTDTEYNHVYTKTVTVNITAPATWTFELYRDSGGDNSGGLIAFDPVLAGIPNVPPARLKITKVG